MSQAVAPLQGSASQVGCPGAFRQGEGLGREERLISHLVNLAQDIPIFSSLKHSGMAGTGPMPYDGRVTNAGDSVASDLAWESGLNWLDLATASLPPPLGDKTAAAPSQILLADANCYYSSFLNTRAVLHI